MHPINQVNLFSAARGKLITHIGAHDLFPGHTRQAAGECWLPVPHTIAAWPSGTHPGPHSHGEQLVMGFPGIFPGSSQCPLYPAETEFLWGGGRGAQGAHVRKGSFLVLPLPILVLLERGGVRRRDKQFKVLGSLLGDLYRHHRESSWDSFGRFSIQGLPLALRNISQEYPAS